MIISYQITFTVSVEISGQIMEFMATLGEIGDLTQTPLPDNYVRYDFTLLTFAS